MMAVEHYGTVSDRFDLVYSNLHVCRSQLMKQILRVAKKFPKPQALDASALRSYYVLAFSCGEISPGVFALMESA